MSLIPFSTLSKLFPCKIRSNYIAHVQLIYCVKLRRLLWCLNSREWLKIQVVCWARLPIHGFMLRSIFKPQPWKFCLGVVPTPFPWAVQETVVWHSWTTAGLSHSLLSKFDAVVGTTVVGTTIISVETPSQAKVLSRCHKVFDICPFS